jgi:hypothetical protein
MQARRSAGATFNETIDEDRRSPITQTTEVNKQYEKQSTRFSIQEKKRKATLHHNPFSLIPSIQPVIIHRRLDSAFKIHH